MSLQLGKTLLRTEPSPWSRGGLLSMPPVQREVGAETMRRTPNTGPDPTVAL